MSYGWPSFDEHVVVGSVSDNPWGPFPREAAEQLIRDGIDHLEAPGKYERGLNFIKRRVEPLSEAYWRATEAARIIDFLEASEGDEKLCAAEALGAHRAMAGHHLKHLPAVRKKKKKERPLPDVAATANRKRKAEAELWHAEARRIAADTHLTGGARVEFVRKELQRQGYGTHSTRTIRHVLKGMKIPTS